MRFLIIIFFATTALAHPVIYKNGTDFEAELSPLMSNLNLSYTFHAKAALALDYFKFIPEKKEFYFTKLNYRLYRQNEHESQSNIYLVIGTGQKRFENKLSPTQIGEVHADWESRDYYISGFQKYLTQKNEDPLWLSRARVGFSPFRADYEDVNIWFIAQFEKLNGEHWETTPMMRTYYKNILWELGASLNGNFQFNMMFHL